MFQERLRARLLLLSLLHVLVVSCNNSNNQNIETSSKTNFVFENSYEKDSNYFRQLLNSFENIYLDGIVSFDSVFRLIKPTGTTIIYDSSCFVSKKYKVDEFLTTPYFLKISKLFGRELFYQYMIFDSVETFQYLELKKVKIEQIDPNKDTYYGRTIIRMINELELYCLNKENQWQLVVVPNQNWLDIWVFINLKDEYINNIELFNTSFVICNLWLDQRATAASLGM